MRRWIKPAASNEGQVFAVCGLLTASLAISDQLSAISLKAFFVSADCCALTAEGYLLFTVFILSCICEE